MEFLDSLPPTAVAEALTELFRETDDKLARSRAFEALLSLKQFDVTALLISVLNRATEYFDLQEAVDWRLRCCHELGGLEDPRAIVKLCDILVSDEDSDLRYAAAEALGHHGDETAVSALEHAATSDEGTDFEGRPIRAIARTSLDQVRIRLPLFQSELGLDLWSYDPSDARLALSTVDRTIEVVFVGVEMMHIFRAYTATYVRRVSAEESARLQAAQPISPSARYYVLGRKLIDGWVRCRVASVVQRYVDGTSKLLMPPD